MGKKKPLRTCPECEEIVPRTYAHSFRFEGPAEMDEEFAAILGEAYTVGCQEHLNE